MEKKRCPMHLIPFFSRGAFIDLLPACIDIDTWFTLPFQFFSLKIGNFEAKIVPHNIFSISADTTKRGKNTRAGSIPKLFDFDFCRFWQIFKGRFFHDFDSEKLSQNRRFFDFDQNRPSTTAYTFAIMEALYKLPRKYKLESLRLPKAATIIYFCV